MNGAQKRKYTKQRIDDETTVKQDYDAVTSGRRKAPSQKAVDAFDQLGKIRGKLSAPRAKAKPKSPPQRRRKKP